MHMYAHAFHTTSVQQPAHLTDQLADPSSAGMGFFSPSRFGGCHVARSARVMPRVARRLQVGWSPPIWSYDIYQAAGEEFTLILKETTITYYIIYRV